MCSFHLKNREATRPLDIVWHGNKVENCEHPKYLSMTLDRSLAFKSYSELKVQGDDVKQYPPQAHLLAMGNKPTHFENIGTNSMLLCSSGPVLSRFDRFLLIGPRAEGSPALRPLTKANLHFLSMLLVYSAGAEPSGFQVALRDQKGSHIFSTVSRNTV